MTRRDVDQANIFFRLECEVVEAVRWRLPVVGGAIHSTAGKA